jgi:hypothetical protein
MTSLCYYVSRFYLTRETWAQLHRKWENNLRIFPVFFYFFNISGNNHEIFIKLITVNAYTTKNKLYKNWIFKIIFTISTDPVYRGTVSKMGPVSPMHIYKLGSFDMYLFLHTFWKMIRRFWNALPRRKCVVWESCVFPSQIRKWRAMENLYYIKNYTIGLCNDSALFQSKANSHCLKYIWLRPIWNI